jgi:hypothetical protein
VGGTAQNPTAQSGIDLQFGMTGDKVIAIQDQTTAATAGAKLTVRAAAGNTSGAGGDLALVAGAGGNAAAGGAASLTGGAAGGGNTAGGNATLQGGASAGTGTGGTAFVRGGAANTTGAGGSIQVLAAAGGATAANTQGGGGSITLQAGSAAANNNSGGSITLAAGGKSGTGTPGVVSIGTPVFTSVSETFTQTGNNQSFDSTSDPTLLTNLDTYGTIVMNVAGAFTGATVTMPAPSNTLAGRVVYVSAATGSVAFTLAASGMSSVNMSAGNTATLVWNGTGWSGTTTASSLQQVYNNTSTSPASIITTSSTKNILLQAGVGFDNANVFQIGNSAAAPVLAVDTTNTATGANLSNNGALETGSGTTGWAAFAGTGSASISRNTTASNLASGSGSLDVTIGSGLTGGAQNDLNAAALSSSQVYLVSFNIKSSSGSPTIAVEYFRNNTAGGTLDATCSVPTNGTVVSTGFFKYTCTFTTTGSGNTKATTNFLRISKTDAGAITHIYIDNLSIIAQNTSGTQNTGNLQVGGPLSQGLTLFTLDSFAGNPFTGSSNQNLLGSMYYDTTLGRMQCYEADGWGSCGAAPNNSVQMTAEYPGAVLNVGASSTGNWSSSGNVGIMTANICSGTSRLSINTSICGATDDFNYYQWTTSQSLTQSYAIYVRYQLPPTFRNFQSDSTISLAARTSSTTDGAVWYSLFKPDGTACGSETNATTSANTWATVSLGGTGETSCGFLAGDIMTFRIEMLSKNNAVVYASNLSFTMTGK